METPSEFAAELRRLTGSLEAGLEELRVAPQRVAAAEAKYRKAKAKAWIDRTDGMAKEREALVDSDTAELRYERDVAEGLRRAALESVRSRQTQISAVQTLVNAWKAEADFTRTRSDT